MPPSPTTYAQIPMLQEEPEPEPEPLPEALLEPEALAEALPFDLEPALLPAGPELTAAATPDPRQSYELPRTVVETSAIADQLTSRCAALTAELSALKVRFDTKNDDYVLKHDAFILTK